MRESNILIAEFLGWKLCNCGVGKSHYQYGELNWQVIEIDSLDFHKNWNSLMPVVTKIVYGRFNYRENVYLRTFGMIGEDNKIMVRFNRHQLFQAETLLEATYLAVIDYIKCCSKTEAQ